jgi:transcriptional antiterminator RfaH
MVHNVGAMQMAAVQVTQRLLRPCVCRWSGDNDAQVRTNEGGVTYNPDSSTWFLAQFKPNSHQIAERNLLRQGFSVFLPRQEDTVQRNGKFVPRIRPLFPGYLFVAIDPARGSWRTVNSTYGISRLVSFGGDPAAVPPDLVAELQLRCDSEGLLLPPPALKPGDAVVVRSGPLADFVASIEEFTPDKRVWILLEIMGGKTRVAIDPDYLRLA